MASNRSSVTVMTVISSSTGRRAALLFAAILAAGVASVVGGLRVDGANRTVLTVFGATLIGVALLMLAYLPLHLGGLRRREHLLRHGVPAIGTVLSVLDPGAGRRAATDQTRVKLRLRVEPTDGTPPFEAARWVWMSHMEPFHPGQRHPMWYNRETPYNFLIGTELTGELSPEVRRLFVLARSGDSSQSGSGPAPEAGSQTT